MPFIHMKVAGPTLAPEQVRRLQQQLTALSDQTFGPVPGPVAVLVEPVAIAGWSIDANPVQVAAHVEFKVARQPAPDQHQEARLIQEISALLERVLGEPLETLSFVVIDGRPTCR
jgi:4-oxalocrotonate tautomerase